MTVNYRNSAGVDFDDLFEPEQSGNGAQDGAFRKSNGAPLRYAALSYGSKIANVNYRSSNGSDVTNLWAGKGSVSYINPIPNLGQYEPTPYMVQPATFMDRLMGRFDLTLTSTGTWFYTFRSTNYVDDHRQLQGGAPVNNLPEGVTLASGNWLQHPGAGAGAPYDVTAGITDTEWGRTDYTVIPPTTWVYQPNSTLGSFNTYQGSFVGTGNQQLSSDWTLSMILDITPTGNNNNSGVLDYNGGISRYWRGHVSVGIRRAGVLQFSFAVAFHLQDRWVATYPLSSGGGPGGGGPGGGGCVLVDSILNDGTVAKNLLIGKPLTVTDPWAPKEANTVEGKVIESKTELQPAVMIETADGAMLGFSTSAPIPTRDRGYLPAALLMGQYIPIAHQGDIKDGETNFQWSRVTKVTDLGVRQVQLIFVENRCFWASADGNWFILHHNLKLGPNAGINDQNLN